MSPRAARWLSRVVGAIFVVAGLPKFLTFASELDAFRSFGLPLPEAWVIAAGIIEIGAGALLLAGRHVLPAATLLAITMAVAVVASGVLHGDVVPSLTLAPVLLVACLAMARHERRGVVRSEARGWAGR